MSEPVKKRRYDGSRRRESAERTRLAVLRAARDLFAARGYGGTSVADIAGAAGVSVDTLYTAVGRKPQILLAVHDMELADGRDTSDPDGRDYVVRMRAAATAVEKLTIYADAMARLLPRTVPLLDSLREAGHTDAACREVYRSVSERRAANMHLLAADLRATGEVRDDLDDDAVAELVWSTNGPDYYLLIRSRGRSPEEYAALVRDIWIRTLLR
jgi:AcrR family transcriptional regulator